MSRPNEPSRPDLYTRITHQIVAQLEAGVRPWSQPWAASESVSRPLRHDGTPYRGVNVVLLWGEAAARGFQSSTWMTFRQALALGAHVRKGEKGSTVVYADQLVRIDDDDAGEETTRRIPFLKAYTVFNVEQIEGLPASSAPAPAPVLNLGQRIARAETFFAATGADVRHGGGCAFYMGRPGLNNLALLDIERVEVAKGPQGTLFGRNTIGGAIAVVSKKPSDQFDAYIDGQVSGMDDRIGGAVNLPINDRVMARIAAQYNDVEPQYWNDFKKEEVGSEQTVAARAQLKFLATDDLSFLVSADYGRLRSDGIQEKNSVKLPGNLTPGFNDPISQNAETTREVDTRGVSLRADWALDGMTLSSITSYRDDTWFVAADTDRTSLNLLREQNPQAFKQKSQEFRAVSTTDGPLTWLAGASYYDERAAEDMTITAEAGLLKLFNIPGAATLASSQTRSQRQTTESWAVFGEVNYALTERLRLTAGLRWTHDTIDQSVQTNALTAPFTLVLGQGIYQPTVGVVNREASFEKLTPRLALDYRLAKDVLIYASVTNGYKSGGFDAGKPSEKAYEPEEVWSYEGGLKSEWLDRRLRVNLSAYYYDYDNLLTRSTINNALVLLNGAVKNKGIESEITFRPTRSLTLTSALSFQKPEYGDYVVGGVNYSGNRLAGATEFTAFHAIDYTFDIKGFAVALRAEHQKVGKAYSQPSNSPAFTTGDSSVVNLRASVEDPSGRYEVAVFGKNVFDDEYYLVNQQLSAGLVHNFIQSPGGYWGLQFRARY